MMIASVLASAAGAAGHGEEGSTAFDAGGLIVHHIANSGEWWAGTGFSKAVLMLVIASVLVIVGMLTAARGYDANGVPTNRWSQIVDPFVEHFYRDIAAQYIGKDWSRRVTPLLLTLFFFVLCCNLLGLLPVFDLIALINHYVGGGDLLILAGGPTATANFNMTATLAAVSFVAIMLFGIWNNGVVGHFAQLAPKGVPFPVRWFLLLPIETLSMFVKPFALTMRLAANMTAGHMALLALLSMIFILESAFVGIPVVLLSTGIMLLEIIVSFVQAYVFAFLTAVFIGMALHPHH